MRSCSLKMILWDKASSCHLCSHIHFLFPCSILSRGAVAVVIVPRFIKINNLILDSAPWTFVFNWFDL